MASARSLLLLSGVDALLFLAAVAAYLLPLLRFNGPVLELLAWTGTVLVVAAVSGLIAAVLVGRPSASRTLVAIAGLLNGILLAATAAFFSVQVRLFGVAGLLLALLAVPGFVGAWIAWRPPAPE